MKFTKFLTKTGEKYGVIESNLVKELEGSIFGSWTFNGNTYPIEGLKYCPFVKPGKIIAIGLNYRSHAEEVNKALPDEPMMFMISPSAIITEDDAVILPHPDHRIDHEAELVVVIGKEGRDISEENALDYVFGYTIGNDVSDRVLQKKDQQYTRAKSFHTFKPIGSIVETELNSSNLGIKLKVNGETKQHSNTDQFIHNVPKLIKFISEVMTLEPGDLIFTGTPEGVAPIKPGDCMEISIENIGTLTNWVK